LSASAPAAAEGTPLAIIAGSGEIPLYVARAAADAGRDVLIIGIEGEADKRIETFKHRWLNWGQVGNLEKTISGHGAREVVMIGGIHARPDFKSLKLEFSTIMIAKELLSIVAGGDNSILNGTIGFMERRGFRVVGAHEVAPDLVALPGTFGGTTADAKQRAEADHALKAARTIGALDAGQAAVVVAGRVVALEGAEGTDAMLQRVAELRRSGRIKAPPGAGVLAKCPKPQQDLRVDMPAVGVRTVEGVIAAGLAGIAVEAGTVMIFDRPATVARADAAGIFLLGVTSDQAP
jgi:DUF1009 family protein